MPYGKLKPCLVKIVKNRWRYKRAGLSLDASLFVYGYDMNHLLVGYAKSSFSSRVCKIKWSDVEVVQSETIVQQPMVRVEQAAGTRRSPRPYKSVYDKGHKV